MKHILIACEMLRNELERAVEETGSTIPIHWMERGLHDSPKRLGAELQQQVDQFAPAYDAILLAYGICGGALDGLVSNAHAKLVLPLVHDCIHLLLRPEEGREVRQPDTLYYTQAWTETDRFIGREYGEYSAKRGEIRAQRAYTIMLKDYHRMDLVDTGCFDLGQTAAEVRPIAERLHLDFGVVPGSISILKGLLEGPWDQGFYVADPGEPLSLCAFLDKSKAICPHL